MTKGRAPDPTRERRGTGHRPPQGQALAKPEVVWAGQEDRAPDPPPGLDEDGKKVWVEALERLGGSVHPADTFALEAMVTQFARMRQASSYIVQYGMFVENSAGSYAQAPWVKAERDAAMAFLRFAEQLGLTRLARTRLGVLNAAGMSLVQHLARELEEG